MTLTKGKNNMANLKRMFRKFKLLIEKGIRNCLEVGLIKYIKLLEWKLMCTSLLCHKGCEGYFV